jgi:hypothetical protein
MARHLTKEQCLQAMDHTKSLKAAARYLGCSYDLIKIYFKLYTDEETGQTLFEKHKNPSGRGVRKFLKGKKGDENLMDIIEGRIDISSYDPQKIKMRLMEEGFLADYCSRCHFGEKRVLDYKSPLLLSFKNGNKKDFKLENLELVCYNCYFLYITKVFTDKEIEKLESFSPTFKSTKTQFELDEYHLERLKELGLGADDDSLNFVSRL